MKKHFIPKLLLLLGICPFLLPLVTSVTRASTWTVLDWVILYSFLYWPTYLAGLALILLAVYLLRRQPRDGSL
ncbi:MAG: hypothetical protein IJ452_08960 [Butyricicoccus sp.]|nr:hypothetical protein [Butyricicoccus sp.]MBQ8586394.1 hypothetical protein [Butyricicoccus sp.]